MVDAQFMFRFFKKFQLRATSWGQKVEKKNNHVIRSLIWELIEKIISINSQL